MTKFGIGMFVLVVILVLTGVGFWTSRHVTDPSPDVVPNLETPPEPQVPNPVPISTGEFNKVVSLKVGEKIIFTDGLTLQVKEINDSRCKPEVQCIWQGELAVILILSSTGGQTNEIHIGTVNNQSAIFADYKITLESATENSANVILSKTKVDTGVR